VGADLLANWLDYSAYLLCGEQRWQHVAFCDTPDAHRQVPGIVRAEMVDYKAGDPSTIESTANLHRGARA